MQKNLVPKVSFLLVLVVLFALLGSAQAATQEPDPGSIATVSVEKDTVLMQPQTQAGFTLTISGPGGFLLQQEYPAGAPFSFRAQDSAGKALPDGLYQYEIRALSQKKPTEQDQAQRGLDSDDAQAPVQSGSFAILDGRFVTQDVTEESTDKEMQAARLPNDQLILDDLIVDGSLCVGMDCSNGESFGFETIRLKENNLRIRFMDTSTTGSFPTNDWQLTANDSSNGGANKFSIDDIDGGRTPFTVEAGAPSNALYVENDGDIGLGTTNPAVDIDIKEGDTPTIRLDQDGSAGWAPQVWDIAGNEANFFIRDVTNGSKLSFRIQPGAPTSSIYIASDGEVGIGTDDPLAALDIQENDSDPKFRIALDSTDANTQFIVDGSGNVGVGTASPDAELDVESDTSPGFRLSNTGTAGGSWDFFMNSNTGRLNFRDNSTGNIPLKFDQGSDENLLQIGVSASGQVNINGDLVVSGNCTEVDGACAPDYVFEDDYDLLTLSALEAYIAKHGHLPNVPGGAELDANGISVQAFNYLLLEKIEELTLYTLLQEQMIKELEARLQALEDK